MTRPLIKGLFGVLLLISIPCAAQEGAQFSATLMPSFTLPLGSEQSFAFGGGASLNAGFRFPAAPRMTLGAQFGYQLLSPGLDPASSSITAASVIGIGPFLNVSLTPRGPVMVSTELQIGYGLVPYQGMLGSIIQASGLADLSFRLGAALSIGVFGGYVYQLQPLDMRTFMHGPTAGIGVRYYLGGGSRSRLEVIDQKLEPIFPVFHAYYHDHPLGSVRIRNDESGQIKNVRVSLFVPEYMNRPKVVGSYDAMAQGQEIDVALLGLFTPSILEVTDPTKAAAEIITTYDYLEAEKESTWDLTLELHHRNAMSWDDDRKAAAFVTPTNPGVLRYAKAVVGELRSEGHQAINVVLLQALALFEAMQAHGVQYVPDPSTPYTEYSQNKFAVDYLQFPSQTLDYRAGDCDDLSILYAALLESVGVETAFVTVPGHIYAAVCLGLTETQARRAFENSDDLVFFDDAAWLPVEITMLDEGFNEAWHYGAREWREHEASENAAIVPVRDAWRVYESVEFTDSETLFDPPDLEATSRAVDQELERFVDDQIGDPVSRLRDLIASGRNSIRYRNQLGAMLARYGRYGEAMEEMRIAAAEGYTPALVNLANLQMLEGDFTSAVETYRDVLAGEPDNVAALVGYAKANRELENFGLVRATYETLTEVDPETASEFAYLIGEENLEGRASVAVQQELFIWPADE